MKQIAKLTTLALSFFSTLLFTTAIFAQSETTIPMPADAREAAVRTIDASAFSKATISTESSVAKAGKQLIITNNAQFCVVSVKVNNIEALGLGTAAFTGNTIAIPFNATGAYTVKVGLGYLNSNNTPNVSFILSYNVTINLNTNSLATVNRFSLYDILCLGSTTTKTWQSEFQGIGDSYRIVFNRTSASMTLFKNNVQFDSGSPILVTWTNQTNKYSSSLPITFKIKNVAAYSNAIIDYPYGRFMMRINGLVYNFVKQ